jgi:hypothetical protein
MVFAVEYECKYFHNGEYTNSLMEKLMTETAWNN